MELAGQSSERTTVGVTREMKERDVAQVLESHQPLRREASVSNGAHSGDVQELIPGAGKSASATDTVVDMCVDQSLPSGVLDGKESASAIAPATLSISASREDVTPLGTVEASPGLPSVLLSVEPTCGSPHEGHFSF